MRRYLQGFRQWFAWGAEDKRSTLGPSTYRNPHPVAVVAYWLGRMLG